VVLSLTEGYARGVVRLFLHPPVYVATPSERPVSSPLARLQAEDSPTVTNLIHQMITLGDVSRHVVRLADGTRTEADLLEALVRLVDRGDLLVHADSRAVRNGSEARALLATSLTRCLKKLCEDALLIG
jgi:methyltransferase-like protein